MNIDVVQQVILLSIKPHRHVGGMLNWHT